MAEFCLIAFVNTNVSSTPEICRSYVLNFHTSKLACPIRMKPFGN
jgi:hypothetical protein